MEDASPDSGLTTGWGVEDDGISVSAVALDVSEAGDALEGVVVFWDG